MEIVIKAPCKINLALDVIGKYKNGYHEVKMVMQALDLYDIVEISKTAEKQITISSDFQFDISNENNTMYKAAKYFFEYLNINDKGVNIKLQKKIPILAGLAGGSTDAAAVLIGINRLFKFHLPYSELCKIGEKVGADVPFCIYGGTRLCTGTGTKTQGISNMPKCYIIIAKPNVSVSTKEAYKKFDKNGLKDSHKTDELLRALNNKDIYKISANVFNRFEDVTDIKDVDFIKDIMGKNGAICSCMSGSGPTVFGIFIKREQTQRCYKNLKKYYKDVFICKPVSHGCKIEKIIY